LILLRVKPSSEPVSRPTWDEPDIGRRFGAFSGLRLGDAANPAPGPQVDPASCNAPVFFAVRTAGIKEPGQECGHYIARVGDGAPTSLSRIALKNFSKKKKSA
jgi:hypothetical protein